MENTFYFTLKVIFLLKIFFSELLGHIEKRLDLGLIIKNKGMLPV